MEEQTMKHFTSLTLFTVILTTIVVACAGRDPLFASPARIRSGFLPHYRVTDLGRLRSSIFVMPQAINNLGQVVGWEKGRQGAVDRHAYLWQHGHYTDLGPGAAYAINNRGQIAGQKERYNALMPYDPLCNSYLWEKGKYTFIGIPPPSYDTDFSAIAINDKGWVLGNESSSLWYDGAIHRVTPEIYGLAINNEGDVAGWLVGTESDNSADGPACDAPTLRKNGQISNLGNSLPADVGFTSAINDHDEVVGTCNNPVTAYSNHAFRWKNGQWAFLPA